MRANAKALSVILLLVPLVLGGATQRQKKHILPSPSTTDASGIAANDVVTPPEDASRDQGGDATVAARAGSYAIDWYSLNGGGATNVSSTNYRLGSSIGQSVAGAAASTNYQAGIGFWYGANAGGGCICPCKYDPRCDGVISDVLDVSDTINRAFRGYAAVQDPDCPAERTDVDASGATDVVDVAKVINVAFRGQSAASNYVDPCSP